MVSNELLAGHPALFAADETISEETIHNSFFELQKFWVGDLFFKVQDQVFKTSWSSLVTPMDFLEIHRDHYDPRSRIG
jgi:hypothetical protein